MTRTEQAWIALAQAKLDQGVLSLKETAKVLRVIGQLHQAAATKIEMIND